MDMDKDTIVDRKIANLMCEGVFPPIFHRFRSKGIYVLRMYKKLNWVYIILDTRIPVNKKTRQPIFGKS